MGNLAALLRLPGFKDTQWQVLAGPILILIILSMMVLPLPPFILDLLFTFNIALSIMVLLVAMFTQRTLDFAAFPTILLFSTLLRLSLNVASTRIILLEGHTGAAAAGRVVEAFGHFLVGGNFAIGIVVFIILVLINFMVITKGAGRIAEVGARFVLDGMPGKQMAIDADLNAGLIGEDEAKKRRSEVTQEADFYPFHQDAVTGRRQFKVVANMNHRRQVAHLLRELLTNTADTPEQLAVLRVVDHWDQAVTHFHPQRVFQLNIRPTGFHQLLAFGSHLHRLFGCRRLLLLAASPPR